MQRNSTCPGSYRSSTWPLSYDHDRSEIFIKPPKRRFDCQTTPLFRSWMVGWVCGFSLIAQAKGVPWRLSTRMCRNTRRPFLVQRHSFVGAGKFILRKEIVDRMFFGVSVCTGDWLSKEKNALRCFSPTCRSQILFRMTSGRDPSPLIPGTTSIHFRKRMLSEEKQNQTYY